MRLTKVVCAVGLLSLALPAGCGGGSGDDDDDDDVCAGVTACAVAGTSCDGDVLVTCAANADGCLVQSQQDCATGGQICDDSGADAICVDDSCSDDTECDGASDGDSFCSGTSIVACAEGADGCLDATVTDCSAGGGVCDATSGTPECVPTCTDDAACTGASDGDSFCDSGNTVDCALGTDGCLDATIASCSALGRTCDDTTPPAACTCSDHPACAGMSDGDTFCDGLLLNTCALNAEGCLELSQLSCAPGTCDADATPDACTVATATGEDCADPYVVTGTGWTFTTADITTYADDIATTDASCVDTQAGTSSDVVFQVDLLTGETLTVRELGGLDAVISIQQGTCGDAVVCVASIDFGETTGVSYTAAADETVYVILEAYFTTPSSADVILDFTIDATCGNGLLEAGEGCDDGGVTAGDGCDDACAPEAGYTCDALSPTTCTAIGDLGTFGAGDLIPIVDNDSALPAGYTDVFTITFTESVNISGTLSAVGTGDPDIVFTDSLGSNVIVSAADGDESFTGVLLAGTYTVTVSIYSGAGDADMGYYLTLVTEPFDSIGDAGSLSIDGGPLAAGASDFRGVTVTEDIMLTVNLTSDDGATSDVDFFVLSADGSFITAVADDFNEVGATVALKAGDYQLVVNAWDGAADVTVYDLDVTAAALSVTDIGTFAAGASITDVTGGPITARAYDHYTITFSEPVLLSGTLGGNTTGYVGVYIYDEHMNYVAEFSTGDESFADVSMPAGTYVVQILTVSAVLGGGDVDAYTLSLSSTTVPAG